ncbi:MAG: hypothetical protein QW658_00305 [Candidatus Bathyarchaeia archaeon]
MNRSAVAVAILLAVILGLTGQSSGAWVLVGETPDGWRVYVDSERLNCGQESESCSGIVKFFPPEKERKRILEIIREGDKEAREELGASAEQSEKLVDLLMERKSKFYVVNADCRSGKISISQGLVSLDYEVGLDPLVRGIHRILCNQ